MTKDIIPFNLVKIETIEFATLSDNFKELKREEHPVKIGLNISFGTKSSKDNSLACSITIIFKQKDIPFLKIQTACLFIIQSDFWDNSLIDRTLHIPKKIADHMAVLSLGVTRGVLHAKTEGSEFNKFIIPQINISKYFNEDVSISFKK